MALQLIKQLLVMRFESQIESTDRQCVCSMNGHCMCEHQEQTAKGLYLEKDSSWLSFKQAHGLIFTKSYNTLYTHLFFEGSRIVWPSFSITTAGHCLSYILICCKK